jgi:germination protein M
MRYAIVIVSAVLAGLVGFGAASCGTQEGAQVAGPTPSAPGSAGSETTVETVDPDEPAETVGSQDLRELEVWFTEGEGLYRTYATVQATPRLGAAALEILLRGPQEPGIDTAIPQATRLLGLSIDGGVASVDLSSEFESGGGSLSMTMRLAQVVYTLTQFPSVEGVRFELDGRPVDVFSGEGIVLDHPVSRADYEQLMPVIVVESPTIGERVFSPVTVSGNANVFEANVTVVILDAAGNELARTFTTATCGTGCRGDFSVAVPFEIDEAQAGTILVHDDDAAGTGTPPHQVRIPVVLAP